MSRNLPPNERLPWTFSLWLFFQEERKDQVGKLARVVEADAAWPSWRTVQGLEEYMKEKGIDAGMIDVLRQAYEEWRQGNHHR